MGEFHTFRLPVPDVWLDILQKMVAAGLNVVRYVHRAHPRLYALVDGTFSIYIHCKTLYSSSKTRKPNGSTGGLTNLAPGVFDFEDWRALQPIFNAAKLVGIFVILGPVPMCVCVNLFMGIY